MPPIKHTGTINIAIGIAIKVIKILFNVVFMVFGLVLHILNNYKYLYITYCCWYYGKLNLLSINTLILPVSYLSFCLYFELLYYIMLWSLPALVEPSLRPLLPLPPFLPQQSPPF